MPRAANPRRTVVAAVVGTVLSVLAAGLSVSTTADAAPTVDTATGYAVSRPLCSQPTDPAAMRCFAVKRVPVAKGTKGAYRFRTSASRGPSGGYTPGALAKAYGYNPKTARSGMTVAIVLWNDAPTVRSDLNHFNKHYGLRKETSRSFKKVNERGRTSPLPRRNAGAAGEIALDTQAVRAVCNTCRILLVEANGPYSANIARAVNTAVRLGADVVSNSYGMPERKASASVLRAFNHPGVVLTASTGDSGWFGWDYANDYGQGDGRASFPSTSPYVVSVGGTSLKLSSSNRRTSETVWNGNGAHNSVGAQKGYSQGASGGGCSRYYNAMPFQAHYPGYAAAKCRGKRLTADMSLVADPATGFDIYDTYGAPGWMTVGGTSLSAPLAAGMYALAGGAHGSAYPASALYGNAKVYASKRYDVIAGGNGYCHTDSPSVCSAATVDSYNRRNPNRIGFGQVDCSFSATNPTYVPKDRDPECNATKGYDGASGVGTPNRTSLFSRTDTYISITAPSRPKRKKSVALRANVRAALPSTHATVFRWIYDGKSPHVTHSRTVHHTFKRAGRHTISLKVTDSRYQSSYYRKIVTVRK